MYKPLSERELELKIKAFQRRHADKMIPLLPKQGLVQKLRARFQMRPQRQILVDSKRLRTV